MQYKDYVVILNYNSSFETIRLFNSLKGLVSERFNILVVDNFSNIRDREELKTNIPKCNLILNEKNLGYSGGNQVGLEVAIKTRAQFALVLNPDIEISHFVICKLRNLLLQNSNIAAIGPRILLRKNKSLVYSDGGVVNIEKGYQTTHMNTGKYEENIISPLLHSVDYVNGSCIMFNLKNYKKIGHLRKEFFLYFEETEWCLRAKEKGYHVVVDSSLKAFHLESEKSLSYYYYMTRNRLLLAKFLRKNRLLTFYLVLKPILKRFLNTNLILKKDRINLAKLYGYWHALIGKHDENLRVR